MRVQLPRRAFIPASSEFDWRWASTVPQRETALVAPDDREGVRSQFARPAFSFPSSICDTCLTANCGTTAIHRPLRQRHQGNFGDCAAGQPIVKLRVAAMFQAADALGRSATISLRLCRRIRTRAPIFGGQAWPVALKTSLTRLARTARPGRAGGRCARSPGQRDRYACRPAAPSVRPWRRGLGLTSAVLWGLPARRHVRAEGAGQLGGHDWGGSQASKSLARPLRTGAPDNLGQRLSMPNVGRGSSAHSP
jgi:hypothetical protein